MSRRQNRAIDCLALAVLMAAGACVAFILRPLDAWSPPVSVPPTATRPVFDSQSCSSLEELAVIWRRNLRQDLIEKPKSEPIVEQPTLALQLLGTIIESDRQYGIFVRSNNEPVIRSTGSVVDGFEITAIERGLARLRGGGREYALRMPGYERLRRN